ncbi:DNA-directed RNA polymerase III subunit RPC2 [Blomia tropicalis]|nr:DNA-directed RNA polymerase III subunit RPC2 [Blomia tropicalis]
MNPANHSDNRDFYGNKRLELAGTLIGYIFEDAFKRYNSVLTTTANRNLPKVKVAQFDVTKHMTGNMITHSLCYAIKTGNWAIRRFRINRVGVSQVLTRTSYLSMVGLLTRVNSQFEKTRKTTGPRSLQSSYWGIICPSDTPEGESCGLVKNLALMCQISTEDDDTEIYQICVQSPFVISYGAVDFDKLHLNLHYLFINGNIVGFVTNICDFTATMREHRRRGRISKYTSIYTNQYHKSVYISSDGGRLCRPYIVVNLDGVPEVTKEDIHYVQRHIKNFDDLVVEGKIEYLDMNELNDCYISPAPEQCVPGKTTHMEIELFTILGICASIIPYPHCNQSPRNTYQCAMGKQAIGLVALNQNCRNDTQLNMLQYPQYPLVQTKPMRMLDLLPAGQNPTVAVMSFSGYDLEDASVLNKSSIEFGYARCFVYKNMKTELKTYPSRQSRDILCSNVVKPDDTRNKWRLSSIEFDGMASPESVISENQIVVHKKSPDQMNVAQTMFDSGKSTSTNYHDSSMVYRNSNNSVIDKVTISNHDEEVLVKILNRQMRPPIVGDKFSSRHGQKGVVGAIFNKTLFPFTSEGISPDMVMNPHGFPSRMTVGKLKEMTASKAAALKATVHDGTIFNGTNMDDCFDIMHKHFRLHSGKELMVSGITGELMPEEIFVGPIYYQRLKHMVSDKVHSRSIGPTTSLTRQPTEGRSRDGGLRVGEMERDCLIGHGTAFSLLERFMLSSDVCEMDVCNSCNFLAAGQFCMKCNSSEDIIKVQIPYAFKLLVQELFSMGVHPAIGFKLKKNT